MRIPIALFASLNDLNEGIVRKLRDVALECSESIHSRCICTMLGKDGHCDILVNITTAGDLSGVSGAETGYV
jgi:hypothetical protein